MLDNKNWEVTNLQYWKIMLTILSKGNFNAKIVIDMEQTQSFLTRLLQDPLAFQSCDLQSQNTIVVSLICNTDDCPGTVPGQAVAQLGQCTSSPSAPAQWEAPRREGPSRGSTCSPLQPQHLLEYCYCSYFELFLRLCLKTEYCSCNFYVCSHNWMRWEKPIYLPHFSC